MKIVKWKTKHYQLTVGLEIHAELNTRTKMFCDSANNPNEKQPNVNICPVCLGYPGTLPVINRKAVRSILRLGVAVGGELADYTEFDRKNYFYPDIPKGYQISQYKYPLVKGGALAGVKLTRIHLEEDTARSLHDQKSQITNDKLQNEYSLIDFNRAGVPLMELVTEPVIHTAEEAMKFAKELQLLLRYLGVSNADMEKGEMRVEANISISPEGSEALGTKVEVKNINSFRAVGKAIEYEFKRQTALLEKPARPDGRSGGGEKVMQETRGWDEKVGATFSQRLKESAHDYRYFPEPDLPKLFISEIPDCARTVLAQSLPELPWQKRERLLKLGISKEHAEIYVTQGEWGSYFDEVVERFRSLEVDKFESMLQLASNYITSELKKPVETSGFVEVIRMIAEGEISSRGAKEILKILQEKPLDLVRLHSPQVARGKEARRIAEKRNLMQISDKKILTKWVEAVLRENAKAPMEFLVGQVMKKSSGRANPVIVRELFLEKGILE